MKVMLVNGSPHEKANTNEALKIVEKALNNEGIDTEIFWIGSKPISGCVACYACMQNGKCIFDDCVNEFVEKIKDVDAFVFGTPVYYAQWQETLYHSWTEYSIQQVLQDIMITSHSNPLHQ